MKTRFFSNILAGMMAFSALSLAGCSETTAPEEEHAEPEGVELVMGGVVVASYDGEDQSWEGELEVDVGGETDLITVNFVDHDGDPVEIEDELYLEAVSSDESIASFVIASPGEFGGRLRGNGEGQTGVSFRLMHGDHPDFVTTPARVHVLGDPS